MPPFAAGQDHLGDLLDGEIGVTVCITPECRTADQQAAPFTDFIAQGLQLLRRQALRGDVDEVVFRARAVLPVVRVAGGVGEALQLADRRRQHFGVVVFVDDPLAPAVLLQQAGGEAIIAEAAAAFPIHGLADATLVVAVDDLFQARNDVRVAVLTQLDHDPAAAHFVGDGAGGAGTGEGVEDTVAGVGGKCKHSLQQPFRSWRSKDIIRIDCLYFLSYLVVLSNFSVKPNRRRRRFCKL